MQLTADLKKGVLTAGGASFTVSCNVRTLKDGTRGKGESEVRRTIPGGYPYDPQPFPKGVWNVTAVERQGGKDGKAVFDYREYGPCKIRTSAYREVNVWELDGEGNYFRETGRKVRDDGYLLHWGESKTTLGCIRLESPADAVLLGGMLERLLKSGETVILVVV